MYTSNVIVLNLSVTNSIGANFYETLLFLFSAMFVIFPIYIFFIQLLLKYIIVLILVQNKQM